MAMRKTLWQPAAALTLSSPTSRPLTYPWLDDIIAAIMSRRTWYSPPGLFGGSRGFSLPRSFRVDTHLVSWMASISELRSSRCFQRSPSGAFTPSRAFLHAISFPPTPESDRRPSPTPRPRTTGISADREFGRQTQTCAHNLKHNFRPGRPHTYSNHILQPARVVPRPAEKGKSCPLRPAAPVCHL